MLHVLDGLLGFLMVLLGFLVVLLAKAIFPASADHGAPAAGGAASGVALGLGDDVGLGDGDVGDMLLLLGTPHTT